MDEIDRKLDKFFADLYGPLAATRRARRMQHLLKAWIISVIAGKRPHESAATGR